MAMNRSEQFYSAFNNMMSPLMQKRYSPGPPLPKFTTEQNMNASRNQAKLNRSLKESYDRADKIEDTLKAIEKMKEDRLNGTSSTPTGAPIDIKGLPEDGNVTANLEALKGPELQEALDSLFADSGIQHSLKNVGKSALQAVGDLASRPLYAVNDAMLKTQQALDEGQNPLGTFDDAIYGLRRGIQGHDKTTPGDVMNYITDPDVDRSKRGLFGDIATQFSNPYDFILSPLKPSTELSRGLRRDDRDSTLARILNTSNAAIGETLLDPANLVGGKAVGVLGKGADAGQLTSRVGPEAFESLWDEVADAAFKKAGLNNPTLRGGRKSLTGQGARGGGTKLSEKVSTAMANQIDDAILTPSGRAVAVNVTQNKAAVVAKGVTTARESILSKFNKAFDRITAGGLKVGSKEYDRLVKNDEVLKAFDDALKEASKNQNPLTMLSREQLIEQAANTARSSIDDQLVTLGKALEDEVNGALFNTVAIRVGNKEIPMNFMGKGFAKVREKFPSLGAPKAFSYDRQLPGKLGLSVGNARRWGHGNYEDFMGRSRPVARPYDEADRLAIGRHIHNMTDINTYADDLLEIPEHLRAGVKFIKDENARLLKEEIEAGVRSGADEVPFNYQYLHYPYDDFVPGATKRRDLQKSIGDARRAEVKNNKILATGPEQAKAMGTKPVMDPFEALAQRRLKSERLKSRSQVTEAFFRTYGISSKDMDAATAKSLGLVEIANPSRPMGTVDAVTNTPLDYKINQTLQGYINTTGNSLYLPKDVAQAFDSYIKLAASTGSEELSSYLRLYDKALNIFKMSATVPFPGFHVKNMAGDIFMGYLDGVKAMDYARYMRGVRSGTFKFKNGTEVPIEDFNALFARYGKSGGFVEQELLPSTSMVGPNVTGAARDVGNKVRIASEIREDFGRKVHFFHALDEGLAASKVKDINLANISKPLQKVLDNATWRINKYKFDYGALTSTEKTFMRRAIPFYTFLRKSAPLMLEGMLMNPSQFGKAHRFFGDEESFGNRAAQWQRELGFANISGGDNPLIMPSNVLPTDAITEWGRDPLSPAAFAGNFVDAMSPIPKAGIELASGRSSFTGQDLWGGDDPSALQQGRYLLDQLIPGIKTAEKDIVQPILKSAGLRDDENVKGAFEDPLQTITGSRFFLGLGTRRLDEESQRRNINSEMGWYDKELKKLSANLQDYGIKVFLSRKADGNSIKVRTLDGKQTIYNGDLKGALQVVNQYTADPRNKVQEGDELVNYLEQATGTVRRNRPAREMSSLDKILQF